MQCEGMVPAQGEQYQAAGASEVTGELIALGIRFEHTSGTELAATGQAGQ